MSKGVFWESSIAIGSAKKADRISSRTGPSGTLGGSNSSLSRVVMGPIDVFDTRGHFKSKGHMVFSRSAGARCRFNFS